MFQIPVTGQRVVIVPGGYPRHIGNISRLLPPLQLFWIEGDASAVHPAMLQKKAIQIVHLISIFEIEEDVQVKTEIVEAVGDSTEEVRQCVAVKLTSDH